MNTNYSQIQTIIHTIPLGLTSHFYSRIFRNVARRVIRRGFFVHNTTAVTGILTALLRVQVIWQCDSLKKSHTSSLVLTYLSHAFEYVNTSVASSKKDVLVGILASQKSILQIQNTLPMRRKNSNHLAAIIHNMIQMLHSKMKYVQLQSVREFRIVFCFVYACQLTYTHALISSPEIPDILHMMVEYFRKSQYCTRSFLFKKYMLLLMAACKKHVIHDATLECVHSCITASSSHDYTFQDVEVLTQASDRLYNFVDCIITSNQLLYIIDAQFVIVGSSVGTVELDTLIQATLHILLAISHTRKLACTHQSVYEPQFTLSEFLCLHSFCNVTEQIMLSHF